MKTRMHRILLSCILVTVLACEETTKEDPSLTVVPAGISMLPAEGGTKTFTVTTNQKDWSVESNKAWCAITNKTETAFTLEVSKNPTVSIRDTAVLTLRAGEAKPIEIGISQWPGSAELSVSPNLSTLEFPAEIGNESNTFTVISNESRWLAKVMTADSVWCKVSMNTVTKSFVVKPLTNTTTLTRSATVRVTGVTATAITIAVTQKARASNSTDEYEYEKGTDWD